MLTPIEMYSDVADRELERRVVNYLSSRSVPGVHRLDVQAKNGVVRMSGKVRSYHQRQLCGHFCSRVAGVNQLIDEIEVEPAPELLAIA